MLQSDETLKPADLLPAIECMWALSGPKILALEESWPEDAGAPVFTVKGRYTARGWTEWTQGFQYGTALLQFDATGDERFLEIGRERTRTRMASHVTHFGVHDHGFNNVSTYGNLWRLMNEGRSAQNPAERDFYELALKASGAVQARRWTCTADGGGFINSFNGPHSLFADTIRSLRSLALAHSLGHFLMDEQDERVSLLDRLFDHLVSTARYSVYRGQNRDAYDIRGRVAHESIFNTISGEYRCPNSQQGYSPFTTWTRGLAWVMLGFAEQLEYMSALSDRDLDSHPRITEAYERTLESAEAACEFYIENTPADGIPYWDTGAPGLALMGSYLDRPAEPFNDFEPVDSSAAAIAAQGLIRLGHWLTKSGEVMSGHKFYQAGLLVSRSLFSAPYLSEDPAHLGLLLHCVYHRPNGWDYIPPGRKIPCGESSMWGDYHLRELALTIQRLAEGRYYTFFGESK